MIDISLIAQDIIDRENTFKTSPDTYDRSKFGLLARSFGTARSAHAQSLLHATNATDINTSDTSSQQLSTNTSDTNASSERTNTSDTNASTDPIIVQGGYITNYFDMTSCKNISELLKAERKKYVNAANLTGGSTITLKHHSKSLNMYPFTLNLLQ